MKKQQRKWETQKSSFRIFLSEKELEVLRGVLFYEIPYIKKNARNDLMKFHWERYCKIALSLAKMYSQPVHKKRKMFIHTMESLDVILGMLEVHLYEQLKDDFSIKLYERLSSIYKKRQKELLATMSE